MIRRLIFSAINKKTQLEFLKTAPLSDANVEGELGICNTELLTFIVQLLFKRFLIQIDVILINIHCRVISFDIVMGKLFQLQ